MRLEHAGAAGHRYKAGMRWVKSGLPLLILATLLAAGYAAGLQHEVSWAGLGDRQAALRAWIAAHPVLAQAAYVAAYAAVVAVSFPAGSLLTAAGGLLFGRIVGTTLAVTGATLGAVLLFLAARSALGALLSRWAGPFLDRLRPGITRHGFSYVLAMRLLPVVPFWLINLASPLLGMKLAPFTVATLLGIIPATFVIASVGAGIGDVLARGERPDLSVLFSPPVLLPLLALAVLSLLPVAWRHWKGDRARA
jgi:uncharacterized membrane protein YdjX (TVP38/TMEM64 family)